MVGRMIDTPAKMSAFLQKIFPKATLMEMPIEAIRQEEAVRREAMAFKDAQAIHTGTPFDQASMDALNAALPVTLSLVFEDNRYIIQRATDEGIEAKVTRLLADDLKNESVIPVIKEAMD